MTLIVFADGHWLRLDDGRAVARGGPADTLETIGVVDGERIVAAVDGTAATVRWVALAAMPRAQAAAAARLLAADLAAEPVAGLHVAVGEPGGDGTRAIAVARTTDMAAWLAALAVRGIDPDTLVPEPLLLDVPVSGAAAHVRDGLVLVRGPALALAAEPELVDAVAGAAPAMLDAAAFEMGLAAAIAALPVDLRQGRFARVRHWQPDRALVRRLGIMAAALGLLALASPIVELIQLRRAAARDTAALQAVARAALPGAPRVVNASAQLAERLAELRGGGLGYPVMMGALFAAVLDTADVRLEAATFSRDGSVRATVGAGSAVGAAAVAERLRARGMMVDVGPVRAEGGRQLADLLITPP